MSPGPLQRPDQLRRLGVLIAAAFVDMIGFMMVLPLLPFYALELRATPLTIGLLIASYSIAQLLTAPLWGRVSDRYGRRPALLIGLGASAIAYAVFGVADSIWLLFASRVVQGAGGGLTGVAQAYVADTVQPADRARALGWLSAATSAGVMIGPALASLTTRLGQEAPGFVAAGLCVVNVFFAWRWLPESRREPPARVRRPIWHTAWTVVRHPRAQVARFVWIYAVGMLAFTCLTSVFALFLEAEYGVTAETVGWFFLYQGLLSLVMRSLLLGPIVDRIGELWAMRAGAFALIVGLVLYPLLHSLPLLLAVMPLVPVGTALLFPSTTSLMSRASDGAELGTTMGTAQTFAGISRVVAPVMATWAFQHLGHAWPFLIAAGFVALVSLLASQVGPAPAPAASPAAGPAPGAGA